MICFEHLNTKKCEFNAELLKVRVKDKEKNAASFVTHYLCKQKRVCEVL